MTNQNEAERRLRILIFWEKHGMGATTEAFSVSKRTLYRWRHMLVKGEGKIVALDTHSTRPKTIRRRIYPEGLCDRIRTLRGEHPRLGKKKLTPLLREEGYMVSESYVGRVIGDLKRRGLLLDPVHVSFSARTGTLIEQKPKKHKKKLRRPHGHRVLEIDTIVRYVDGVKRYILTAVDTETRVAFAGCYTNHGSASAADFLRKTLAVIPNPPNAVQTDNGSEFALHFARATEELGLTHYHTYPRTPKMNAHVERFNRTLWEEFGRYHRGLLRDDVSAFNTALVDWLLWYNGERPHHSLGNVSPLQYTVRTLFASQTVECQRWWTYTTT
jgi:transposase InsO family protein